jgi:hypothetical protein
VVTGDALGVALLDVVMLVVDYLDVASLDAAVATVRSTSPAVVFPGVVTRR